MYVSLWNDPAFILYLILAVFILENVWTLYLLFCEIRVTQKASKVPEILRSNMSQESFSKMRIYKLHKYRFQLVNNLIIVLIAGIFELVFGFYAFLWNVATKCALWNWMSNEACIGCIFALLFIFYLNLKALPGYIYEYNYARKNTSSQQREKKGIGKIILSSILDSIANIIVIILITLVLVFATLMFGVYVPIVLFFASVLFSILMLLLMPCTIRLFIGKTVELQNMALATDLKKLCADIEFPYRNVKIIRPKNPQMGSNAFFYGCCCLKRIYIFDSLLLNRGLTDLSELRPEERGKGLSNTLVIAVVTHELGHWHYGHFYKALLVFKVHLAITFVLFALFFWHGPIYEAFGFESGEKPIIPGYLIIFGFVLTPYLMFANVFLLWCMRGFEYEADRFAYEMNNGKELIEALLKLYADNGSFPITDPCYSACTHTHPSVLNRIDHIEKLQRNQTH